MKKGPRIKLLLARHVAQDFHKVAQETFNFRYWSHVRIKLTFCLYERSISLGRLPMKIIILKFKDGLAYSIAGLL